LRKEKQQRKTTEKLALKWKKETEDNRRTISLLSQLIQKYLRGDIDSLLTGNFEVPFTEPSLSIPAPSLQGILSVAFLLVGGASGS
jgi:hypothetical protein